MNDIIQNFTHRQTMATPNYEYFHYKDTSSLKVKYHNHDFYEILFFISGKVIYAIEGFNYRLEPGDILLINNNDLHQPVVDSDTPYERAIFWIKRDYLENVGQSDTNLLLCFDTVKKEKNHLLRPNPEYALKIKEIRDKFENSCNSISYGNVTLRTIYLTELLITVNKAYIDCYGEKIDIDKIKYNPDINRIIEYINFNISGNLSLDMLSDKFFISKYHMEREFKKYTGLTIHKYITQKRLILSKEYLQKGFSVIETYQKCGFNDYSNFIRTFKNEYGIPPKKFFKKI